jgi:hypothetical protein
MGWRRRPIKRALGPPLHASSRFHAVAASPAVDETAGVLTVGQRREFERTGIVKLEAVFADAEAARMRDVVWLHAIAANATDRPRLMRSLAIWRTDRRPGPDRTA